MGPIFEALITFPGASAMTPKQANWRVEAMQRATPTILARTQLLFAGSFFWQNKWNSCRGFKLGV